MSENKEKTNQDNGGAPASPRRGGAVSVGLNLNNHKENDIPRTVIRGCKIQRVNL